MNTDYPGVISKNIRLLQAFSYSYAEFYRSLTDVVAGPVVNDRLCEMLLFSLKY